MTWKDLMAMVDNMNEAAKVPKHTQDYVRDVALMAYTEGERNGRIAGLEQAATLMEAAR